jgi:acetolactate synthase-1/3 small subunit
MCIVLNGQRSVIEQARRQLEDLVPVWAVLDYTHTPKIQRELLLVKVSLLGPEYLEAQLVGGPTHDPRTTAQQAHEQALATHRHVAETNAAASPSEPPHRVTTPKAEMPSVVEQSLAEGQAGTDPSNPEGIQSQTEPPPPPAQYSNVPHPHLAQVQHAAAATTHAPQPSTAAPLTPSQVLQLRAQHLHAISVLSAQFGGRLVDVSENTAIVELAAKTQRVDAFLRLLSPYGVLEAARSGMMTLPRTPLKPLEDEEDLSAEEGGIDMSMLPPG